MIRKRRHKGTTNRIICALMWWYWESHTNYNAQVVRVYSFTEYQTLRGHYWVDRYSFFQNLWRATGVIFISCKKIWDRLEHKMWPPTPPPSDWLTGM